MHICEKTQQRYNNVYLSFSKEIIEKVIINPSMDKSFISFSNIEADTLDFAGFAQRKRVPYLFIFYKKNLKWIIT